MNVGKGICLFRNNVGKGICL